MYRSIFQRTSEFGRTSSKTISKNFVNFIRGNFGRFGILQLTADEVIKDIDLSDKTCLITGANSGIGLEMTRVLNSKNCTVLMACRNTYAADVVARTVCERTDRLKLYHINLASLASVQKCSEEIVKNVPYPGGFSHHHLPSANSSCIDSLLLLAYLVYLECNERLLFDPNPERKYCTRASSVNKKVHWLASEVKKVSTTIGFDRKLDIVILNAAVFGLPWTLTEDALETTFQVNYLSHAYLLMNIEKVLAPDVRVVFTSSESHRHVNWPFNHKILPTKEMVSLPKHEYTSIKAYNISKLCGILFMHYLGYRWLNTGKSVFCAHPGTFVKTRLCTNWWPYETLYKLMKPFSKTISQAASTPIYCAVSPDLNGLTDQYYKDLMRCDESDLAQDFHLAFRLYDLTQELLYERAISKEEVPVVEEKKAGDFIQDVKETIDESTLVANYSG